MKWSSREATEMKSEGGNSARLPEGAVKVREGFTEPDRPAAGIPGGLLTMCAWCKKIRDDLGYWKRADVYKTYILENSYGRVTHGICPECACKLTAELEAC